MKKHTEKTKPASPRKTNALQSVVNLNTLTRSKGSARFAPAQNRFSIDGEPDTGEAGVLPFPKVVVVYDDVPAGQRAVRMMAKILREPEDRLQLLPRFWRADLLEDADWFTLSLADAADADIIVITTSATHGLNTSVEEWIKSCLPRRRRSSAAVVALLGPGERMDAEDSPRFHFLQDAVQTAGLAFFAPQFRRRHPFPGGTQTARDLNQKEDTPKLKARIGNNGMRHKGIGPGFVLTIGWIAAMIFLGTAQARSQTSTADSASDAVLTLEPTNTSIWQNGVGEGFKPGTQSISLNTSAGYGLKIFGSEQTHDLALASISYGYMLGPVEGEGHWYRGNWEFRGELFGGAQFYPSDRWLVGLTPHLRYNLATGTRWIPYLDAGAGATATSIGPPDLSHTFEFNLQAATGVRWFITDNVALGVEVRYLHLSCASMYSPNLGLNNVNASVGISWFF